MVLGHGPDVLPGQHFLPAETCHANEGNMQWLWFGPARDIALGLDGLQNAFFLGFEMNVRAFKAYFWHFQTQNEQEQKTPSRLHNGSQVTIGHHGSPHNDIVQQKITTQVFKALVQRWLAPRSSSPRWRSRVASKPSPRGDRSQSPHRPMCSKASMEIARRVEMKIMKTYYICTIICVWCQVYQKLKELQMACQNHLKDPKCIEMPCQESETLGLKLQASGDSSLGGVKGPSGLDLVMTLLRSFRSGDKGRWILQASEKLRGSMAFTPTGLIKSYVMNTDDYNEL